MLKRQLVLEDGMVFTGEGFGSQTERLGEVIFHTGMTGYQELISNPSCSGQMMVMTYPLIGNYGMNRDDYETITPFIHGLIVKEYCDHPSNFRSEENLSQFLEANEIPGIAGIDTRKLTRYIRENGTMKGCITMASESAEDVVNRIGKNTSEQNLVQQVSTGKPYVVPGQGARIVLVDFGMKHGILRELMKRNCHITIVPYNYSSENILRLKPDGILLSNGPGNPKAIPGAIEMIEEVLGNVPVFGMCLGHQLLALACGANTEKMIVGHHGSNHPVKDLVLGKTYMTAQNHHYLVTHKSIEKNDLDVTHVGLNDRSIEGFRHKAYSAFGIQFHPEGAPGAEDTIEEFDTFLQLIARAKAEKGAETHA